jgi:hypothetical protein
MIARRIVTAVKGLKRAEMWDKHPDLQPVHGEADAPRAKKAEGRLRTELLPAAAQQNQHFTR